VNPQYALNSSPTIGPDFSGTLTDLDNATKQYQYQYGGAPTTDLMLSNFDWYRLLTGTANFQSTTTYNDLYPGRYGEATSVLHPAFQFGIANGSIAATPLNRMAFPGVTGSDDNWNLVEGRAGWEVLSNTPGFSNAGNVINYTPNTPRFYPGPLSYFASQAYGQPLDFKGDGTSVQSGTYGKSRLTMTNPNLSALSLMSMNYPVYWGYDNPGGVSAAGLTVAAGWSPASLFGMQMRGWDNAPYFTAAGQGPLTTTNQMDEDAETIVDPAYASRNDSIFDYSENAAWHLSPTDRTKLSLGSRSRTLSPFNLQSSLRADTSPSSPGDGIAKRFTTASFDRKQHGYAGTGAGVANGHRPWELMDLVNNTTGAFTPDGIGDTFPPQFGTAVRYTTFDPLRPPVRKLLELTVSNTTSLYKKQFRLSLNHLTTSITGNDSDVTLADPTSQYIIQRPITPHDTTLTNAVASSTQELMARKDRQQMARDIYVMLYLLGGGLDGVDAATSTGFDGSSILPLGYTGDNSNRQLYTDRQLREMAQFAVNVVDSLDSDHIMTKFEYDKNLGNGWGDTTLAIPLAMDDDPYTPDFAAYPSTDPKFNAEYPEDSDERGVVFGVEAQQLTFSEIMAFKCPKIMKAGNPYDHKSTLHNDEFDRFFTFIELRNIGLDTVEFSNSTQEGHWRIRVLTGTTTPLERRITLKNGNIGPGQIFTLGNAGETDSAAPAANVKDDQSPAPAPPDDRHHSRFRVDASAPEMPDNHDFALAATRMAPNNVELDLDLIMQHGKNKFRLTNAGSTPFDDSDDLDYIDGASSKPGALLNNDSIADPTFPITFILERRQYPDRLEPTLVTSTGEPHPDPNQQRDNPWVPVDVFLVDNLNVFGLTDTDTMASNVQMRLQSLRSRERDNPLRRRNATTDPSDEINLPPRNNTLMYENDGVTSFSTWQIMFDRPFASPVELFRIPLFGPRNVTKWSQHALVSPHSQTKDFKAQYDATVGVTRSGLPFAATAGGKILQPEDYDNQIKNMSVDSKVPANDNRWYRLFEFFEVPTRTHRQLGNPLDVVRTPGKVNLNGIRHPDVLAGLLDDADIMRLANSSTVRPTLSAQDISDADATMGSGQGVGVSPTRDWWVQFLKARDGRRTFDGPDADTLPDEVDANSNPIVKMFPDTVTGLYLPGLADSSPFRSFASLGFTRVAGAFESPETALDQTLFRRLPYDMLQPTNLEDPTTSPSRFSMRHLWEVGGAADHQTEAPGLPTPEPLMADRLLSKIYNNTTNRSHVFLVFVSVKFFQADDTAGAANVRIGGPLTTTPTYRGFFVIDRSNPEEAYDVASGQFTNFRSLIKYRLRID
jgi:hypothetical protein